MLDEQLELNFEAKGQWRLQTQRQRRMSRAQWWFNYMREVVERAAARPNGASRATLVCGRNG